MQLKEFPDMEEIIEDGQSNFLYTGITYKLSIFNQRINKLFDYIIYLFFLKFHQCIGR